MSSAAEDLPLVGGHPDAGESNVDANREQPFSYIFLGVVLFWSVLILGGLYIRLICAHLNSLEEYSAPSELADEAGLSAMSRKQRLRILQHIFQSTSFQYRLDDHLVARRSTTGMTSDWLDQAKAKKPGCDKEIILTLPTAIEQDGNEDVRHSQLQALEEGSNTVEEESDQRRDHRHEEGDGEENMDKCAICQLPYSPGEEMMKGRVCSHHFHRNCGMKWLEASDRCPQCRALLVTPEEFKEAAREILDADLEQDVENFTGLRHDEFMIIFSYSTDRRSEGQSSSTDEETTISDEDLDSISLSDSDSSR